MSDHINGVWSMSWVFEMGFNQVSPVLIILEVRTLETRPLSFWMVSGRCLGGV